MFCFFSSSYNQKTVSLILFIIIYYLHFLEFASSFTTTPLLLLQQRKQQQQIQQQHGITSLSSLRKTNSNNSKHLLQMVSFMEQQESDDGIIENNNSRRSFFQNAAMMMAATAAATTSSNKILNKSSSLLSSSSTTTTMPYCCRSLVNSLPPKPSNMIRLYLCRHGQTENNRLHQYYNNDNKDPPLNSNGIQMSERLGIALNHIIRKDNNNYNSDGDSNSDDNNNLLFYHSTMLRATQTASIAASQFYNSNQEDNRKIKFRPLSTLVELDYSSSKGEKSSFPSRSDIDTTYNRWSSGYIDDKLGHESARDIFQRCASALSTMIDEATTNNKSIVAVAHGSYLRMLLTLALDIPLSTSRSTLHFDNASISVLDIPIITTSSSTSSLKVAMEERSATSYLFNNYINNNGVSNNNNNNNISSYLRTKISSPPSSNLHLSIPKAIPIRINEVRHLNGIPIN